MSMFENIESALVELREDKHIMALETNALDWYKREKQRIAGNIETALQKDKEYHEESVTYHQACVMEFLVKLDQLRMQSQNPEVQEAYRMAESLFKAAF